jgi:hypothetical protein
MFQAPCYSRIGPAIARVCLAVVVYHHGASHIVYCKYYGITSSRISWDFRDKQTLNFHLRYYRLLKEAGRPQPAMLFSLQQNVCANALVQVPYLLMASILFR